MEEDRVNLERKRQKSRKIYSTEVINQLLKDQSEGYDIDYDPFFNRDLELRDANVPFRMTKEEMEIYQKCVDDPLYYIENYCKFLTDTGRSIVKLRDYQKEVIDVVTAEKYDKELDIMTPVNKNIIWMASRQVGKCITGSESIDYTTSLKEKLQHKSIISIYNRYTKNTFIKFIKNILYRIYSKL